MVFRVFILFIGIFCVSCNTPRENVLKIISRGPSNCVDILVFESTANKGYMVRGKSKGDYKEDFTAIDDTLMIKNFKISKSDELKLVTSNIEKLDFIEKTKVEKFAWDAKHVEIFINNRKVVDSYGLKNRNFIDLYMNLVEFMPYDINSFCE